MNDPEIDSRGLASIASSNPPDIAAKGRKPVKPKVTHALESAIAKDARDMGQLYTVVERPDEYSALAIAAREPSGVILNQ